MFAADPEAPELPKGPAKLKRSLSIKNFQVLKIKSDRPAVERRTSDSELSPIARFLVRVRGRSASQETIEKKEGKSLDLDGRPRTPEEYSGKKTSPLANDGSDGSPLKRFLSNKKIGKVGRPSSMCEPSKLSPKTCCDYDDEGPLFNEAYTKYQEAKEKDAALFDTIEEDLHEKAKKFSRSSSTDQESWKNLQEALNVIHVFRTLRIKETGHFEKVVDISELVQKKEECRPQYENVPALFGEEVEVKEKEEAVE